MGERKVLSKYYPPDFDPSKVPRLRKPKDKDNAVRFMLPMSVRCTACGAFMGRGLKFNAKKNTTDEDYLGIRIYRFTMRCKECPEQFAIKTDPQNSDYTCDYGVKRNFEPWREKAALEEGAKKAREEAEQDTMVRLENKTSDAKREMEELDEIDALRALRNRSAGISPDAALAAKRRKAQLAEEREANDDEAAFREEAARAFARKRAKIASAEQPATVELSAGDNSSDMGAGRPEKLPSAMGVVRKKVVPAVKRNGPKVPNETGREDEPKANDEVQDYEVAFREEAARAFARKGAQIASVKPHASAAPSVRGYSSEDGVGKLGKWPSAMKVVRKKVAPSVKRDEPTAQADQLRKEDHPEGDNGTKSVTSGGGEKKEPASGGILGLLDYSSSEGESE